MSRHILNELQLLTAMFDPRDIVFHDPEVVNLIENCIPIADSVSLTARLNDDVELDIRLPLGYPDSERLSAHCRIISKKSSSNAVQQWESLFNGELNESYVKSGGNQAGPNILGVIQWCNEHFDKYPVPVEPSMITKSSTNTKPDSLVQEKDKLCRIWIFSHHIYNKNKRRFLVNTADDLDLSGFSLPGKPGFICVEGDPKNCDEYWTRVRQLNWQKISLIERQTVKATDKKFPGSFQELLCDKSAFMKYLEDRQSSEIIKEYLGF